VGTAVVGRDDFDILAVPASVRLLVLDPRIWKVDLVIEVWQVVFIRPFTNLVSGPIGMSVVVVAVPVTLVQPALVVAFELVVEDDAVDAGAALEEPRLGLFIGSVDLEVVLQFPLAREAA